MGKPKKRDWKIIGHNVQRNRLNQWLDLLQRHKKQFDFQVSKKDEWEIEIVKGNSVILARPISETVFIDDDVVNVTILQLLEIIKAKWGASPK